MLLNVVSEDDDTDGNTPIKKAFPQKINEIRRLIVQTKTEEEKILSYANVEKLDDISDQRAQTILHLLKDKQNKQMAPTQQQTAV
ncbi:Uncharacterised protein [Candidatus Bartonella washoeensis]|uniref:Uncharacterized protein n=1 Tax=Candidatus Bartonella washoeensis Sb944nv TaxID=1094563 RepID=J1J1L4_9HYPH|nr:hypothetical protein MCQ_01360 [Bartonella washoeensis Sb944nv]SPU27578.1 Uncharacterised protein [Bartonella washoeensis]